MWKNSLKTLGRSWTSLFGDRNHKPDVDLADGDEDLLRRQLDRWLNARGGEVSARRHAIQIGELYRHLTATGRKRFLRMLARDFGIDQATMREQCRAYIDCDDDCGPIEDRMRDLLVPPRLKLLSQFSSLPNGIKFLVDLREDLIGFSRDDSELKALDREIHHLLATWFDIGLLKMRQVDWQSPAAVLEKLVEYEAVHQIDSWQDLRHRLHLDRRCYAFFHPNMPGEPLIFVEVALTDGMADNIQELLDESTPDIAPEDADTAIFYSISNAQKGLKGISFGNFLIKRVVDTLSSELPNVKTFATLSPIPGFRRWLESIEATALDEHLDEEDREALAELAGQAGTEARLTAILEQRAWYRNEDIDTAVRPMLERLLYEYLHTTRDDGQPIDPVERFHLGNGARLERVNWLGDLSGKGLNQSYGMMVNYCYRIKDIEKNHELYATRRKIVVSSAVKGLK